MDADRYFAAEWPATARRLGRALARHGVNAHDREDILQETALRLYRSWASVDVDRGVEPFARTIALNLLRDNARRSGAHGEVLGDVPDRADSGDVVERTTIARLELGHVRRALTRLRPVEQRVLTEAVTAEITGDQSLAPASVRMARMRARRQLVAVLRAASAWVGVLAAAGRALRSSRVARPAVTATAVAVVAVSLLTPPRATAPREVALGPTQAGDAANRADVTRAHAARAFAPHAVRAVTPAHAPARHRTTEADQPYVHIDTPVGQVNVLVRMDIGDATTVQVRDRGSDVPVCVSTPLGPLHQSVDCA